jgi:oxygen-independent coproporphyrinogen-3 oxidase
MLKISEHINEKVIDKFVSPGPYYTSYPTLGEWSYNIRDKEYLSALERMEPHADDETNALYIHFPYCPKLCYFCICNVTITHERSTINKFLQVLMQEIDMLFSHFEAKGTPLKISDIHLGGGTPSYLSEDELSVLVSKLKSWVKIEDLREFAIEFDPRSATDEKFTLCHELGFNRVSMGIQDFRPEVQEAVNRIHSFDMVQSIMSPKVRSQFNGFNFDLLYGLPLQTRESFQETLRQVVALSPERITLLKYAHVPDVNKHMQILDSYAMANNREKAWMFIDALEYFTANGWEHVGLDHFAKSSDSLAIAKQENNLKRGFIGFSSGGYDRLLGVGPSSTMKLDDAYFQNICNLSGYVDRVNEKRFPILSGYLMDKDDQLRRDIIDSILCDGRIDKKEFNEKYGIEFDRYFSREQNILLSYVDEGVLSINTAVIELSELGKTLFKRHVSKVFDQFLMNKEYKIHGTGNKKHL